MSHPTQSMMISTNSDDVKDYRIEVSVKNNRILYYMHQMGYSTVSELCRDHGIDQSNVGMLIHLKKPAMNNQGEWRPVALKLAAALACSPDELWSDVQRHTALVSNKKAIELAECDAMDLLPANDSDEPYTKMVACQLSETMMEALSDLTNREARVIRMRFGLDPYKRSYSLAEVAAECDVTRERVRSIEMKALWKMRNKSHGKKLLAFYED